MARYNTDRIFFCFFHLNLFGSLKLLFLVPSTKRVNNRSKSYYDDNSLPDLTPSLVYSTIFPKRMDACNHNIAILQISPLVIQLYTHPCHTIDEEHPKSIENKTINILSPQTPAAIKFDCTFKNVCFTNSL